MQRKIWRRRRSKEDVNREQAPYMTEVILTFEPRLIGMARAGPHLGVFTCRRLSTLLRSFIMCVSEMPFTVRTLRWDVLDF